MRDLNITYLSVAALKPYTRNPRTHSKTQLHQIAASIETFGWTNPILIDGSGGVIAGHGRLEAAKLLGIEHVPTIRIEDMSEAHKRAYVIADNKLAENAGWDTELLAIEMQALTEIELGFDIETTGFAMGEIDILIGGINDSNDEADQLPRIDPSSQPVSRPGDLWLLGRHRLLCADATKAASFTRLMNGEQAQMVFTDPPYNVPIDGHVSGLGAIKHSEFAMAAGEMSEVEFTVFLETVLANMAAHGIDEHVPFADSLRIAQTVSVMDPLSSAAEPNEQPPAEADMDKQGGAGLLHLKVEHWLHKVREPYLTSCHPCPACRHCQNGRQATPRPSLPS